MEERTNILLVDDHPENLTALEAVLEDLGQNLVKASSAQEALKCLMQSDEEFAVILLDVQMPEMDGFEAAALIRKRAKFRATPIIFLTALNRSDLHVAHGYATGAVDYLFKPFDPTILRAKVAVFVELAKKTKALQSEMQQRKKAQEEVEQLNHELATLNKDLERRVRERTSHIEMLNRRLEHVMHETHDRVRNNMQLLIAMLDMQVMEGTPSIPIKEIHRLGRHVRTLALVHDLLTEQIKEDAATSALSVQRLLHKVLGLVQQSTLRGTLSFHVDDARLPVRESTSLALVTNELSHNAFRHGRGEVDLTFTIQDKVASLQVCDNGPGFPSDFRPKHESHTGLQFIEDLTHLNLNGKLRYENRKEGGARVIVTMPYEAPKH